MSLAYARTGSGEPLVLIHGLGHVPMTDDPERVAAVLLDASA